MEAWPLGSQPGIAGPQSAQPSCGQLQVTQKYQAPRDEGWGPRHMSEGCVGWVPDGY